MEKNILIVDTDKGFSTILSEGLNSHTAFNASVVYSSTATLQSVVEKPIDLVIVDLSINDMPILKLIKAIREAKAGMPIMVTPLIGQEVPEKIKQEDIQGIVPKPFFVGDLPKIVGDALGLNLDSQVPDLPATKAVKAKKQVQAHPQTKPQVKEEPASKPAPESRQQSPAGDEVFLPTLPSWKLENLRKSRAEIVSQLKEMNRDFGAEVILLTAGSELIAQTGTMRNDRIQQLAILVAKGAEAAAQVAEFLGERAARFEQSLHEGNEYRLYSYSLGEGVVLSMALSPSVPLGILRHQTKRTSQKLMKAYIK